MIWVVGDLQGCLQPLIQLLAESGFRDGEDRLWVVGDMVNRGSESAATLRYLRKQGERVTCVLGNHDFYLLALAAGMAPRGEADDQLREVLAAPDADELIEWLRHRPFLHVEGSHAMVHAGLLPQWTIPQALALAREVETALQGRDWKEFLLNLWGNRPDAWADGLAGWDRLRVVVNAMARMRFMTPDGRVDTKAKGPLESCPPGLIPWFAAENPAWATHTILCGHWSALGFRDMGRVVALDSGCVWGGKLTAFRLEDRAVFQVDCPQCVAPNGWD